MGVGRSILGLRKVLEKRFGKKSYQKRRGVRASAASNSSKPASKTLPKSSRSRNDSNGIPYKDVDGERVQGQLGPRIPRTKGDHKQLNQRVYAIKKQTRMDRERISEEARSQPTQRARQDYLDRRWIEGENQIMDARKQFQVYGKKSVQGRLLDQKIKGLVNTQNHIERLAGVRDSRIAKPDGRKRVRGVDQFGKTKQLSPSPYSGPREWVTRQLKRDADNGIYYSGVDYNQVGK